MAIAMGARFNDEKGATNDLQRMAKFTIYMENMWHIAATFLRNNSLLIFDSIAQFWKAVFPLQERKKYKYKSMPKRMLTIYNNNQNNEYQNSNVFTCSARIIYLLLFPFFSFCLSSQYSFNDSIQSRENGKQIERNMKQRHSKSLDMWNAANGAEKKIHSRFQKFICCMKNVQMKKSPLQPNTVYWYRNANEQRRGITNKK